MSKIQMLDEQTIDKIAAGEVVERPRSIVKELVENAIDAKATAITVEIKDGGTTFIRITDNGQGIAKDQVPLAFMRHATSKIRKVEDLLDITSLGFRGEALSSIAAVSQVELITKVPADLTGTKYKIEGSQEMGIEDIGAPDGTTFLVRNLFYNTPARQKFLKSPQTEASYIGTLMERLALSHPDISFQFLVNNQPKLHTNGNAQIKDIIYHIYGREIAAGVLALNSQKELLTVEGYIGKPFISRGNRNYETYFINGRYVKSPLISKSIEDAYKPYLMKHQYPFTVLHITVDGALIDVNVHPSKMEVRFRQEEAVYQTLLSAVREALEHKDLVPEVPLDETSARKNPNRPSVGLRRPEPFEKKRLEALRAAVQKDSPYEPKYNPKYNSNYKLPVAAAPASEIAAGNPTGTPIQSDTSGNVMETPLRNAISENASEAPLHNAMSGNASETLLSNAISGNANETPLYNATSENANVHPLRQAATDQNAVETTQPAPAQTAVETTQPATAQNVVETTQQQTAAAMHKEPYANIPDTPGIFYSDEKKETYKQETYEQLSLAEADSFHADFIAEAKRRNYTVIGQLFDTYWLVQTEHELFIIDQHAAHEKVLYEQMMAHLSKREFTSQQLCPPTIITMTMQEEQLFHKYEEQFSQIGFEVNDFGGREYAICAVPANLFNLDPKGLFLDMLDNLSHDTGKHTPDTILEKIASMSCKAAVKGSQRLTRAEVEKLLSDLLQLENPYNCPHGRPTIIAMSQKEIERKFKRIV